MSKNGLRMKPVVKVTSVLIALLALGYLAISGGDWNDGQKLAFGLLFFISGFWAAQDDRFWRLEKSNTLGQES